MLWYLVLIMAFFIEELSSFEVFDVGDLLVMLLCTVWEMSIIGLVIKDLRSILGVNNGNTENR